MCVFDPFCGEVVGHCAGLKVLESGVLYLVQPVVVQDGDEGVVICNDCEVWQPCKKMSHFDIAHATARSSSSMIAYRDAGSLRKREPAWTRAHLSSFFCCRIKPRPCLLASVQRHVGLLVSKNANVGATVSDCLALSNAWSCSVAQVKSFLVLRRGRSGARSPATALVLAESWFARPMKERRSVRFDGVGNLDIASVIEVSTL